MTPVETTAQESRPLPSEIHRRLRQYRRLCANVKLVNGLAKLASVLLLLLIGAVVLFHLEVFGFGARKFVIGGWVLATFAAVWLFVELRLAAREQFINDESDDVSTAAKLERDNPVLNESLLSTVEIFRSNDPEEVTGSPQLVAALAAQTSDQLKAMRVKARVSYHNAAVFVLLTLVLGWSLLSLGMPKGMGVFEGVAQTVGKIQFFELINRGWGDDSEATKRNDKKPTKGEEEPIPEDEPSPDVEPPRPQIIVCPGPVNDPFGRRGKLAGGGDDEHGAIGVTAPEAAREWRVFLADDDPTADSQKRARDVVSPLYEAVTREYFRAISEGRAPAKK